MSCSELTKFTLIFFFIFTTTNYYKITNLLCSPARQRFNQPRPVKRLVIHHCDKILCLHMGNSGDLDIVFQPSTEQNPSPFATPQNLNLHFVISSIDDRLRLHSSFFWDGTRQLLTNPVFISCFSTLSLISLGLRRFRHAVLVFFPPTNFISSSVAKAREIFPSLARSRDDIGYGPWPRPYHIRSTQHQKHLLRSGMHPITLTVRSEEKCHHQLGGCNT